MNDSMQTLTSKEPNQSEYVINTNRNMEAKSVVWKHFEKVKVYGKDKAQCRYYRKFLEGEAKNGTNHLHHHMERCIIKIAMARGKGGKQCFFLWLHKVKMNWLVEVIMKTIQGGSLHLQLSCLITHSQYWL